MKAARVLLFLFVSCTCAFAQERDTLYTWTDTLSEGADTGEYYTGTHYEETVYHAAADSFGLDPRAFHRDAIQELRADPDLNYELAPTVVENLWGRFLAWLRQIFNSVLSSAIETNLGSLLIYAAGLALLILLIVMVLKVNAFKVVFFGQGIQKYQVLDENIHEMDFEQLIQKAIEQQDYRRGIRLLFLYALKLLSDRHLIQWEAGKTNHEYASELDRTELKSGFHNLNFYFEYAWYGNFAINQQMFRRVQDAFMQWRARLN